MSRPSMPAERRFVTVESATIAERDNPQLGMLAFSVEYPVVYGMRCEDRTDWRLVARGFWWALALVAVVAIVVAHVALPVVHS